MDTKLLQYAWQWQLLDTTKSLAVAGRALEVDQPGVFQQGAFMQAKLRVDQVVQEGTVLLGNPQEASGPVILQLATPTSVPIPDVPVLSLVPFLAPELITAYHSLQEANMPIPCAIWYAQVPHMVRRFMRSRALCSRLEAHNQQIQAILARSCNSWEETAYTLLVRNFGFKAHKASFSKLADTLPLRIVQAHYHDLTSLEALLLGQAGLLRCVPEPDAYTGTLIEQYAYLAHKYQLSPIKLLQPERPYRPANAPALRLAQLAQLLHQHRSIFTLLLEEPVQTLQAKLQVQQSSYFQAHYACGKATRKPIPGLGVPSSHSLLINTAVPLLVAYGKYRKEEHYMDRAVQILESLPPEDNQVTRAWEAMGEKASSALDSQGSIELYKKFCQPRRCLSCSIGHKILQQAGGISMKKVAAYVE